ncbi:uncharacterized protein LOC127750219 [Frankliniella occidentalis]|uniref:Uncharacterized protein LOC127750219 n=1 Tax=Frankliniella occidentalis TaxID=133901 RepID=A0A9C6X113_FRAOC|nr:uncharacterized protein LOC127750219 [Frankliniella occidentalis]
MDATRLAQVPQLLQVPQPAAPQRTSRAWQGDSYELQWLGAQRVRSSPSFPPPAAVAPLPQAPEEAAKPVKATADQGGRDVAENHDDLFGGNGMYEDLRPLALGLAVCGLLPVAFRPERFSFHPGRSTLLYSLAVTLAICWSGWRLVTDRLELLETRQRVSLNTRFTSVVSFGSMTGLCMTPLLWFEARHVRRHQPAAAELMDSFGATFRRSPRRWARTLSWSAVVLLAVFVPACEAMWIYLLAAEGGHWTHIFAHNQVLVVPIIVSCLVAGSAYCVKRFADALRTTMSKELRRPWLVASRVDAYRRAWLQLRDLTERLVRTPLTAIAMLLHMLLMSTLAVYQALIGLLEGEVTLGVIAP